MISEKENVRLSKLLSYVLRHDPAAIGIHPDEEGWVPVEELVKQLQLHQYTVNREILNHIVATNNKKRFAYNEGETMIRASQGHSIPVDLGYEIQQPPAVLYHGTSVKNLELIMQEGLKRMGRHHVHLSANPETAFSVGRRHGHPVVLTINARAMFEQGFRFYLSENGVWLTETVPVGFIEKNNYAD